MSTISELIGSNTKRLRKAKGWTQTDLAVASGFSMRAIQEIESARVIPAGPTVRAIAEALGVEEHELVYNERAVPDYTAAQLTPAEFLQKLKELNLNDAYSEDEKNLINVLRRYSVPGLIFRLAKHLQADPQTIFSVLGLREYIPVVTPVGSSEAKSHSHRSQRKVHKAR